MVVIAFYMSLNARKPVCVVSVWGAYNCMQLDARNCNDLKFSDR